MFCRQTEKERDWELAMHHSKLCSTINCVNGANCLWQRNNHFLAYLLAIDWGQLSCTCVQPAMVNEKVDWRMTTYCLRAASAAADQLTEMRKRGKIHGKLARRKVNCKYVHIGEKHWTEIRKKKRRKKLGKLRTDFLLLLIKILFMTNCTGEFSTATMMITRAPTTTVLQCWSSPLMALSWRLGWHAAACCCALGARQQRYSMERGLFLYTNFQHLID